MAQQILQVIKLITAIVMASGHSKRMGKNKLLMNYKNKPIIQHTLETINKCNLEEKILITQYKEVEKLGKELKYKVIINKDSHKGQSESIKLGLINSKESDGYMFFVGDQPLLSEETINKLIATFEEDKTYIIIPRCSGVNGSPVIYPSIYKEELLKLEGDKGGKQIIKTSSKVKYVEVDKESLFDIDNETDYNKLRAENL